MTGSYWSNLLIFSLKCMNYGEVALFASIGIKRGGGGALVTEGSFSQACKCAGNAGISSNFA